jgi:hypothetical protein
MRFVSLPPAGLILLTLAFRPEPVPANDSRSEMIAVTVVDEGDLPISGAAVRVSGEGDEVPAAATNPAGVCRIPLPPKVGFLVLIATDAGGARLGYLRYLPSDLLEAAGADESVRIVLKAPREVAVRVTDRTGAAASDVLVALLGSSGALAHKRTNRDGLAQLLFPADADVSSAFALKSGLGFNQWNQDVKDRSDEPRKLPRELTLTLSGAQTVRIRATDSAGEPVAGVAVFPQFIRNRSRYPLVNNSRLADTLTDDQGVATIDWFPAETADAVEFSVHSAKYFLPERRLVVGPNANPAGPREFKASLLRRTKISGRVTGPDGKPAAGIRVLTSGAAPLEGRHEATRTAADGTYAMQVFSQYAYIVAVVDNEWAAKSHLGVVVLEDKPVTGLDFELIKGTAIRGTITSGREGLPAAKIGVSLREIGGLLPPEFRPDQRRTPELMFGRSCQTDARGEFQFRVGPGNYELWPPPSEPRLRMVPLTVGNETEIVRDLHLEGHDTGVLSGKVLGVNGLPVKDVVIRGNYVSQRRARIDRKEVKAISDVNGMFRIERQLIPLDLLARSSDGALAGWGEVDAEQDSVTLKVASTATHYGRLIDDDGPIADAELTYGPEPRSLKQIPGNSLVFCEIGTAATDSEGRFALPGLVVGTTYVVSIHPRGENGFVPLPFATPIAPGESDLGNVLFTELIRRWHVRQLAQFPRQPPPPSAVERALKPPILTFPRWAARKFHVKTDVKAQISNALADANRENLREMLLIADPESPAAESLFEFLEGDNRNDELKRLLADFLQVAINADDRDAVAHLRQAYELDVANFGLPALVVLDGTGAVTEKKSFAPTGDPPQLDAKALRDFLKRHAPPVRDADEVMRTAGRRARDENKRILLQHSGPDSYPCRLLTRFIDQHRELFERDYVYVNLDAYRSIKGDEAIAQFRKNVNGALAAALAAGRADQIVLEPFGKTRSALPWMAVLNSDCVKLADSEGPDGNIGFPSEPEAIDYFIDKMLRPTARQMTAEQLEELRQALRRR